MLGPPSPRRRNSRPCSTPSAPVAPSSCSSANNKLRLLQRSSKAVYKAAAVDPGCGHGAAPDPRLGTPVELAGGDLRRVVDLRVVGKALAGERLVAEQAPPGFLAIEPRGALGKEDVLDPRMPLQPRLNRRALV